MEWVAPRQKRPEKARIERTVQKVMLVAFIDSCSCVYHKLSPMGVALEVNFMPKFWRDSGTLLGIIHQTSGHLVGTLPGHSCMMEPQCTKLNLVWELWPIRTWEYYHTLVTHLTWTHWAAGFLHTSRRSFKAIEVIKQFVLLSIALQWANTDPVTEKDCATWTGRDRWFLKRHHHTSIGKSICCKSAHLDFRIVWQFQFCLWFAQTHSK